MSPVYPVLKKKGWTRQIAFWFVFLLPVFLFYYVHVQMAVNVPYQDDFDGLLDPTTRLSQGGSSLGEFWQILSAQDDEHRIVMDRLLSFLLFKLEGQLYLPHLMLLGALAYLALLGVLVAWFRQQLDISPYLLLAVPYLLFTQTNYQALYWPIVPNQHITVYIWAFVSFWFLTRTSATNFVFALLFAIISLYSDVTGSITLVAGSLILVLQRQYKRLAMWAGVLGVLCFFYFYQLVIPSFRPPMSDNLRQYEVLLSLIVLVPGLFADIILSFPFPLRLAIMSVFGLASLALVGYSLFSFYRQYLVRSGVRPKAGTLWLWGCLFMLGTTFGMLALGRAAEGIQTVMLNRYRHMYTFWLVFNFLLLIRYTGFFKGQQPWKHWSLIGLAMGYFGLCYFEFHAESDYFRKELLTDTYEWKNNRTIPSSNIYVGLRESVDQSYLSALKAGVYVFPELAFANLASAPVAGTIEVDVVDRIIDYRIAIPEFERGFGLNDGAYVILQSERSTHILPTKNEHYTFRWSLLRGKYYMPGAVSGPMPQLYLKDPSYTVRVGVIRGDKQYILDTGAKIVPGQS